MTHSVMRRIPNELDTLMDEMMDEFNKIFGFKPSKTCVGRMIAEDARKNGIKNFVNESK